jgi:hypothetical protein
MPTRHGLGWGNGTIVEHEDGSAGYIPTASLSQVFRVQIADVTGFSVTKGGKMLERTINVLGNGTLLGSASVNHGTSEKIEHWFRSHPLFGQRQPVAVRETSPERSADATSSSLIADELRKLAELRSEGILTEDEFLQQKAKLLAR